MGDFTFWLRLSLRLLLSLNFGLSFYFSQKVKWFAETFAKPKLTYLDQSLGSAKVSAIRWVQKYLLKPKLSQTNLAKVGSICMEEIALALRA